jgi:DnaJ-class molecular chaperone
MKSTMPRDYYEVLGVPRTASEAEIKKAYLKLARKLHPDRNPGDKSAETKFNEVQEAFNVLGDKNKRAQYDSFGFAGPGGAHGGFPEGAGFDPRAFQAGSLEEILRQFGGAGGGAGGIDLSELFGRAGAGGGGRRRGRHAPAQPAEAEASIPFLTAATGGKVTLSVNGQEIDVKVPAGVEEGKKLRLPGQAPGGGDLYLRLHIEPHPYFRREGHNLILEVPIGLAEAVLGTKVDVPTLDGQHLTVKIPPGTSSGARLRLRGKGIAGGDQFIEIRITVPKIDDARGRELIEEFARLHPQHPRSGLGW